MALGMSKIKNLSVLAAEEIEEGILEWVSDEGTAITCAAPTTEQVVDCLIQYAITFVSGATEPTELHIRHSVDGGTTEDTADVQTFAKSIESTDDGIIIGSHMVPGGFDYLDIGFKNTESGNYHVTVTADVSYTKITGMTAV